MTISGRVVVVVTQVDWLELAKLYLLYQVGQTSDLLFEVGRCSAYLLKPVSVAAGRHLGAQTLSQFMGKAVLDACRPAVETFDGVAHLEEIIGVGPLQHFFSSLGLMPGIL